MQKIIAVLVALATAWVTYGLAAPDWGTTVLREDGTGFVAGSDVRDALGWSADTLQAQAASLEFVAESRSVTGISWECVDPGTSEVLAQRTELVVTESRGIGSTPHTMWWRTVIGFRLHGFDGRGASSAVPEGPAPSSCPVGPWTLVPGSTATVERTDEPVLMVVHEGVQHPLPVR